jgi:hypothetical protein
VTAEGPPSGDERQSEPQGKGSAIRRISRRDLLQGAAAAPILLSPASAFDGQPVIPESYELRLNLSQSNQFLTVVERAVYKEAEFATVPPAKWSVHSKLFGPKAWFDLVKPASADEYILKIFDASFGDRRGVEFTFAFSRKASKPKAKDGSKTEEPRSPWVVDFSTNLWSRRGADSPTGKPVAFCAFAASVKDLESQVAASDVDDTLRQIFRDHVRAVRQAPRQTRAAFNSRLLWTLSSDAAQNFSTFDGQAFLKEFKFGWHADQFDSTGEKIVGEPFLAGSGTVRKGGIDLSILTIGNGHHAELRVAEPDKERDFEVRIGVSPIDLTRDQVVSRLDVGSASVTIGSAQVSIAGAVSASDLVLSQTVLPKSNARRTVLWGHCGLDTDPQATQVRADEISTPIGRLTVAALRPDQAIPPSDPKKEAAQGSGQGARQALPPQPVQPGQQAPSAPLAADRNKKRELFFRASCGDRAGARQATIWIVDDVRHGQTPTTPRQLRRVALDLSLLAANVAPEDVSFSSLVFQPGGSDLRLIFEDGEELSELTPVGEFPRVQPSSFVWVGPPQAASGHRADIDLSRAILTVSRDYDLMKLRFKFLNFVLAFTPAPVIRPARADCRLIRTEDGKYVDSRPVLVAEFDPQHVFEEALFRPEPPELPDVIIKDEAGKEITREMILAKLERLKDKPQRLRRYRERISKQKKDTEEKLSIPLVFKQFAEKYGEQAGKKNLPRDQRIYIGPYGLDPDAMHLARSVFKSDLRASVEVVVRKTFERVKGEVRTSLKAASRLFDVTGTGVTPEMGFDNALRNERAFEEIEPVYAAFRAFYREERLKAEWEELQQGKKADPQDKNTLSLSKELLWRIEFLSEENRPAVPEKGSPYPSSAKRTEWFDAVFASFMKRVLGTDDIKDLMEGRLSGLSRLAFHVNCMPPSNATSQEAGLRGYSGAKPSAQTGGAFAYDPIPFTFEALTDWSRHEPAVTLRARKLFTATPWGVVPPLGARAANLNDHDVLAFQGFSKGFLTAEQRLGEVRASMARKPTLHETAIEIPSRLVLSTAQDAIWQTERRLPSTADLNKPAKAPDPRKAQPPRLESGLDLQHSGQHGEHIAPLWTARLAVDDINPGLRIVDTPDFRPMVLAPQKPNERPSLPGRGAPPRGPLAPWFIGPEHMESVVATAEDVNASLPDGAGKVEGGGEVCAPASPDSPALPEKVFQVIKWLCGRAAARKETPISWQMFYSTLDAYDRHQLVMLSSAYGLPVIGKRETVGGDADIVGPLLPDSGQFEPGNEKEYALSDGRNDQAIYRPIPLNVRELSLTALGGSFNHDTAFRPSAGADDLWGRKLFEGFSIERWQQNIVLGRDILGQVVYKGYLFPFGHRASMIKQTERVFLRTSNQGVKAILRQRIFLHVAQPVQRFPALGQPHRGSMWCSETVTLRTIWTPDILDPNAMPVAAGQESLNGRIGLGDENPGLAFFPRTDITERGFVNFELLVDDAQSRLPLVFVDNIAATTASSLEKLVNYYNGLIETRRTLAMNGQKVRFAPENRPGDTVLTTESILVSAHGRLKDNSGGWAGDLSRYLSTGALEGARQPPFYPAMDKANVRLEQVERFSGGRRKPVDVQYDGHYVRHGFAGSKDNDGQPKWNPLEVYLNLRNVITSGMGDNGARGGGIGRPASNIVALSRSNGPLGGDRFVRYELVGYDDPVSHADVTQTEPIIIDTGNPETTVLFTGNAGLRNLRSLAAYFDHRHELSVKNPAGPDFDQLAHDAPGPVDILPREPDETRKNILKTLQILQSYFSGEAKLLGTVKIKYLLALLDLDDLLTAVPVLRETVEYGTAASKKIDEVAADIATDVRTRVILPLAVVIARLRGQWNALDSEIKKKAGSQASALSLAKIFPEIDGGLADIEKALEAASVETDPIRLAEELATVYESGRRFIRMLSAIASNPVERLRDAATRAVNDVVTGFSGDFLALSDFRAQLAAFIDAVKGITDAEIEKWIADSINDDMLIEQLSFSFVQPDFIAIATSLVGPPPDPMKRVLEQAADKLNTVLPTARDVAKILAPAAVSVLRGKKPEDALRDAFENWIAGKRAAIQQVIALVKDDIKNAGQIQVEAVRGEIIAELDEFDARVKQWFVDSVLPEYRHLDAAMTRALELFARIDAIATAGKAGDPGAVIRAAGAFSSDVLGFNIEAMADENVARYKKQIEEVRVRIVGFIKPYIVADENERKALATELEACLLFKANGTQKLPAATQTKTPLVEIGSALDALQSLNDPIQDFKTELDKINPLPDPLKELSQFHAELTSLVAGLIKETKGLYCAAVESYVLLNEVKTWLDGTSWTALDKKSLEQLTRFNARVGRSIKAVEDGLTAIITRIATFSKDNAAYVSVALIAGGASKILPAPPNDAIRAAAEALKQAGDEAEAKLAPALATVIGFVLGLANDGSMLGAKIAEELRVAVVAVAAALRKVDRDLGDASTHLEQSLASFQRELKKLGAIAIPNRPASYTTIRQLLDENIKGLDVTVRDAITGADAKKGIDNVIEAARKAELDALVLWRKLQQKVDGLPDQARQKIARAVIDSQIFKKLVGGYATLLSLRERAIQRLSDIPLLSLQARHALLVPSAYDTKCEIDNSSKPPSELAKCDRLFEEHAVVLTQIVDPLDAAKQELLRRFFGSWIAGTAAPLAIGANVRDLAAQVLKGDILSLIDVAAFRDAIEDAISELIPTRATLAFDFSRAVKKAPSESALFQAKQGTVFAIKVRAIVDLLKTDKVDFRANGSLGPFDVKLVGGLIDALTLKFDGAAFEMVDGSEPRFDVVYRDFEIGNDLKFAQQLQSFLSPKDGSGIFVQPMTRTAGIEAGYGIDLGSIGCGVTSFFNVSLNVSAELPFTNSESLFKVSLGRRLRPFTMSVVPFAGSGYFSIFAAPDGIRGFEASFEFGGGASLGFGPLQAQVRVMVGVFIRVLRVDNTNTCTIYGTFFAGGSASIWIFSFSASLYVRLGRSDNGSMYGEAVYTFSFSLGIVDYDYSITAYRREQAIGGGNNKSASLDDTESGGATRLAFFSGERPILSDAPPIAAAALPKAKAKSKAKPKSDPKSQKSEPASRDSDVMSEAVGPLENLNTYLSYFDLKLLDRM